MLRKGALWINNVIDLVAAFIFVYFSHYVFHRATTTFFGALLTAILLAVTEYMQHLYLICTNQVGRLG